MQEDLNHPNPFQALKVDVKIIDKESNEITLDIHSIDHPDVFNLPITLLAHSSDFDQAVISISK